ncbi:MAG: DUF1844 domain-containing protein [Bryobacteraceae bacterium]|jgi:hypothetical protein
MSDTETPKTEPEETPAQETEAPQTAAPETGAAEAGAEAEASGAEEEMLVPPPTFEFLVLDIVTAARLHLGLLHFGEEKDRPKPNLRAARHAIDMLGMLLEKTQGNLEMGEKRLLENSLTELRFRYVQAAEEAQAK